MDANKYNFWLLQFGLGIVTYIILYLMVMEILLWWLLFPFLSGDRGS